MRKVWKMGRLQMGITSFISNVLVRTDSIQQYSRLFKVLNKANTGKISRQEFRDSYNEHYVKGHSGDGPQAI